jgi:hypothetical protein
LCRGREISCGETEANTAPCERHDEGAGRVAQEVKCLPCKCEALSSNPGTTQKGRNDKSSHR